MEERLIGHGFVLPIRDSHVIRGQKVIRPLKTRFIVNPGSHRARSALGEVRAFAARQHAGVVLTERPGHAAHLARSALAEGCELVVAVGGDGTMNEVAAVVTGTSATLGLIPCGSGNGLARHLRIHGAVARALDILTTGAPRLIDTGIADGHPFFTAAGIGFEAEIAQRFNRLERRGFLRYLTTSATAWREWKPQDYVISHDGRRETFHAFTVAIADAAQYGNNALIAPGAKIDDGELNLTALPPMGFWNSLPLIVRLFCGTIDRAPSVKIRRSHHFVIERAAPGWLHTDGEIHEAGPRLEFSVRPTSLRILAPP